MLRVLRQQHASQRITFTPTNPSWHCAFIADCFKWALLDLSCGIISDCAASMPLNVILFDIFEYTMLSPHDIQMKIMRNPSYNEAWQYLPYADSNRNPLCARICGR
mmetsp:Transcript_31985/g.83689  ORF Transcript_31985/g.83689 Transcript_31985/m.83689 type:complete len:106 (+) Transcript_31985:1165-1482(+)